MAEATYMPFKEINFGFSDAEEYLLTDKELFNAVFIKDELDALLKRNTYYLIGEKGTGKTAYAVYLENNNDKTISATRVNLNDTTIQAFISMKKNGDLPITNYQTIWEVVLLINMIRTIKEEDLDINPGSLRRKMYSAMIEALEKYELLTHTPEIASTIKIISKCSNEVAGDIEAGILAIKGAVNSLLGNEQTVTLEQTVYPRSLERLNTQLKSIIGEIRLKRNKLLFIDKVDIYNSEISYDDYVIWIKNLAEAIYSINNQVFGRIKGKNGFAKVVLLIRPDIFNKLDLYNQGNRIRDNSIVLDWQTTYAEYKHSKLLKLADNLLRYANREIDKKHPQVSGFYWNYYFPWKAKSTNPETREYDDAFISFLRLSLCRPRDIVEFLKSVQTQAINVDSKRIDTTSECFYSAGCQKSISDYFLQEARDWCRYKYPYSEFETIKYFFAFMSKSSAFTYDEYLSCFNKYIESCKNRIGMVIFQEMQTPEDFLQLLYDLNMICYLEEDDKGKAVQVYCYRLRSISDLSPKIPPYRKYRVHRALLKSLNIEQPR